VAQIPEWMTRPEAATLSLRRPPMIPVHNTCVIFATPSSPFQDCSATIRSAAEAMDDGAQMIPSRVQLRMGERAALLPLVRRLLLEVMVNKTAKPSSAQGSRE
jgi:hypothetical protein